MKTHSFYVELVREDIGSFEVEVFVTYTETPVYGNKVSYDLVDVEIGFPFGANKNKPLNIELTEEEKQYVIEQAEKMFAKYFWGQT
jgi:hypothetical protein